MLTRMLKTAEPRRLILSSFHFPHNTEIKRTSVRKKQTLLLAILKSIINTIFEKHFENLQPENCISVRRTLAGHTRRIVRIRDHACYSRRDIEEVHQVCKSPDPESSLWHVWRA